MRGAARRLLKGLPQGAVDKISNQFTPRVIPWDFVDLIERDPARRVKLKVEQDRLSSMRSRTSFLAMAQPPCAGSV